MSNPIKSFIRFRTVRPATRPPNGFVDLFWDRVAGALKLVFPNGETSEIGSSAPSVSAPLVATTVPVDGANAVGTVEWQSTTLADGSIFTIGGVAYTFRASTPDAELNEFTTYEDLGDLLNDHPLVFTSLTSFSAPSSTHKVYFTSRLAGVAGNNISASASNVGLIIEAMTGGSNSTPQADYAGQLLVVQFTPAAGFVNVYVASSEGHTAWMPFVIND